MRLRAAASGTPGFIDNEVPLGTIDGNNTVFSLSNSPNPSTSLMLFINGVLQTNGTDYSLDEQSDHFRVCKQTTCGRRSAGLVSARNDEHDHVR